MKRRSTRLLPLTLLSVALFGPVIALVLRSQTVLVANDGICKDLKGTVRYHTKVLFQLPDGTWKEAQMTACSVPMPDRAVPPGGGGTLGDLTAASTFYRVVETAKMGPELDEEESITIFAPSNKAMKQLPVRELEKLTSDRESARAFVLRHVVMGKSLALDTTNLKNASKLGERRRGAGRAVTIKDSLIAYDDAPIFMGDIEAKNGLVHVIDSVLPPR
ncbi:MAG: fasciclin domain-containing protein [Fimbriimonadaceae bacterium]|nr:fasciclin domain-containing protein [Fimbriimonadaceae bacterium]